jgi:hypothetical protein
VNISDEAEIAMSVAQYEENMRWAKEKAWREGADWAARQVPYGLYHSNPYRDAGAGE